MALRDRLIKQLSKAKFFSLNIHFLVKSCYKISGFFTKISYISFIHYPTGLLMHKNNNNLNCLSQFWLFYRPVIFEKKIINH